MPQIDPNEMNLKIYISNLINTNRIPESVLSIHQDLIDFCEFVQFLYSNKVKEGKVSNTLTTQDL